MATLLEELDKALGGKMTAEQKLAVAILQSDPTISERLEKGNELFSFYTAEEAGDETPAAKPAAEPAAPAKPATEPAAPAAAAAAPATPTAGLTAELTTLLNSKFDELKKDFVPMAKVQEFRTEILTNALKMADDYATIRETHREEFGEKLNRGEFEKFVAEQKGKYATLTDAHNAFVSEKRVQAKVDKAVAEAKKQMGSAASVPAQTSPASASPNRAITLAARKASGAGDGTTSMERATARLRELNRAREGADAGAA